ncbi:phage tail terminator protein [Nitrospina gracilis]|uniref:phage tail terminator protein n=1 Tax=Nitrospina gracilis TaxID=35801 RepID=UPI001F3ACEAB|nr:phage protein Gp37 [Nitrospina gracilis]MCF8719214.1 phage gp37-like protein [Nitrospina gracilis Nb-211]
MPTINQVEDAVVAALNAAPLNTYCKRFEKFDSQFDIEDLDRNLGPLPVCFVAYLDDDFSEVTQNRTYMDRMRIAVIVAAKNLRSGVEAKTGTGGTNEMLNDVKSLLHKNTLGLSGVASMALLSRRPVVTTKTLSVWQATFELQFVD